MVNASLPRVRSTSALSIPSAGSPVSTRTSSIRPFGCMRMVRSAISRTSQLSPSNIGSLFASAACAARTVAKKSVSKKSASSITPGWRPSASSTCRPHRPPLAFRNASLACRIAISKSAWLTFRPSGDAPAKKRRNDEMAKAASVARLVSLAVPRSLSRAIATQ